MLLVQVLHTSAISHCLFLFWLLGLWPWWSFQSFLRGNARKSPSLRGSYTCIVLSNMLRVLLILTWPPSTGCASFCLLPAWAGSTPSCLWLRQSRDPFTAGSIQEGFRLHLEQGFSSASGSVARTAQPLCRGPLPPTGCVLVKIQFGV